MPTWLTLQCDAPEPWQLLLLPITVLCLMSPLYYWCPPSVPFLFNAYVAMSSWVSSMLTRFFPIEAYANTKSIMRVDHNSRPPLPWNLYTHQPVEGIPGCFWILLASGVQIYYLHEGQRTKVWPLYLPVPGSHWWSARGYGNVFFFSTSVKGSRAYSTQSGSSSTTATGTGSPMSNKARSAKIVSELFRQMNSKVIGDTNNTQTKSKLWMASGLPPTAAIITEVLGFTDHPVTEAELALCINLYTTGIIKLPGTLAKAYLFISALFPKLSGQGSTVVSGVYIMNSTSEWAVGVGSTNDLRLRLRAHRSNTSTMLGQYAKQFGSDQLTVKVMILPSGMTEAEVERMCLILEQYTFFMEFGVSKPHRVINLNMVANGSGSSFWTPDQLLARRIQLGTKVHVVSEGVHVGSYHSRPHAHEELGVSVTTLQNMPVSGYRIPGTSLHVYEVLPAGTSSGLLSDINFKALTDRELEEAKLSGLSLLNGQIPASATCTVCGTSLTAESTVKLVALMKLHNGRGSVSKFAKALATAQSKGLSTASYSGYLITRP